MVGTQISKETVRAEVRAWLDKQWDPEMEGVAWRRILVESGWGMPMWPDGWYGKGFDKELARVVADEFAERQVPGLVAGGITTGMGAPTILAHGTDAQKRKHLPRMLTGEENWCQLFSEPGSGSDVAASTTRAERHGDEWIINGQKVWTSGAGQSEFGMLLCRTDWDVPKHEGLSYFILHMRQPGIEIRPIRQMSGGAGFNEVFFHDARVPHENLVGDLNGGWAVAVTTLMNERVSLGGGSGVRVGTGGFGGFGGGGGSARGAAAAGGQQITEQQRAQMAQMMSMSRSNAMELAKQNGKWEDPVVRQELMRLYTLQRISGWNAQRSRASDLRDGRPGPEGSLGKLSSSEMGRLSARIGAMVAGADVMLLTGAGAAQLGYHMGSIAGGTDNIQKNIVGERVLGLPKDPQVDAGIPFREVRTNAPRP